METGTTSCLWSHVNFGESAEVWLSLVHPFKRVIKSVHWKTLGLRSHFQITVPSKICNIIVSRNIHLMTLYIFRSYNLKFIWMTIMKDITKTLHRWINVGITISAGAIEVLLMKIASSKLVSTTLSRNSFYCASLTEKWMERKVKRYCAEISIMRFWII